MSQAEDLDAIDKYISKTGTTSSKAFDLQTAWNTWFDNLGWYEKQTDADIMAEARRRKADFDVAMKRVSAGERIGVTTVNEPFADLKDGGPILTGNTMPMIRQGSGDKEAVKTWQRIVGASPIDGLFGPNTDRLTRSWQTANGLVADGIVGPASWSKALGKQISTPSVPSRPASVPQPSVEQALAYTTAPGFSFQQTWASLRGRYDGLTSWQRVGVNSAFFLALFLPIAMSKPAPQPRGQSARR